MKKIYKNFAVLSVLSTLVSANLAFSPINAFAAETTQTNIASSQNSEVKILKDNNKERIVTVKIGNEESTTTFNKETNIFTIETNGKTMRIDANKTNVSNKITTFRSVGDTIVSGNDAWWGSSYAVSDMGGGSQLWSIKSSSSVSKGVMLSSSNDTFLNNFRKDVDQTSVYEFTAINALDAVAVTALIGLLTGPETFGLSSVVSLVLAAGGTYAAANAAYSAYNTHKDAVYYFSRI